MSLIALRPYKVGEVISECKPIIHCIECNIKSINCDNCLKRSDSLKKCSKCRQMFYCDQNCQKNDWEYHKNECKLFRNKPNNSFDIKERLLLRLWLSIKKDPKFVTKRHKSLDGRDMSIEEFDFKFRNKIEENMNCFEKIVEQFKGFGLEFNRKELLFWYQLVCDEKYVFPLAMSAIVNDVTLKCEEIPGVRYPLLFASGIFANKSYFSHSCVPNSDFVVNGLSLVVKAMKPIASGEVITRSLVFLVQNKIGRQSDMRAKGLPLCECDKCRLNLDEDMDYEECHKLMANHMLRFICITNEKMASKLLNDFQIDWQFIMYLRESYGQNSLQVSEMLVTLLGCFVKYSRFASKSLINLWYKEIEPIVYITHGSDHPTYKKLLKVYENNIDFL